MPIRHSGDLALIMFGFIEDGNLVSFGLGEVCVIHSRQLWLGGLEARMLSHLALSTC